MRAHQVRSMTPDQLDDELIKLKKEQFNLRFQAASASLRTPRGSDRSGATSRASRRSAGRRRSPK